MKTFFNYCNNKKVGSLAEYLESMTLTLNNLNTNPSFVTTNVPYLITDGEVAYNQTVTWTDNSYAAYDPYAGYHTIIDVIKRKCFKGVPMYEYELTLDTQLLNRYCKQSWPLIIEGYNDWFFISKILNNDRIVINTPMHVLLTTGLRIAPLNQYDVQFTNEYLINLVNAAHI